MLVTSIDGLDWYSAKEEGLGDLYEGLLEKNASEKKSGAGQYFTPRVLIDAIVRVMDPQPVEVIQDPAAGTGGFLIAADRHIKKNTDQLFTLRTETQNFQKQKAFQGVELVQDAHRLLMMNLLLHGIESEVKLGDSLGVEGVDGVRWVDCVGFRGVRFMIALTVWILVGCAMKMRSVVRICRSQRSWRRR
jgi:type I restriction enzyme M protein